MKKLLVAAMCLAFITVPVYSAQAHDRNHHNSQNSRNHKNYNQHKNHSHAKRDYNLNYKNERANNHAFMQGYKKAVFDMKKSRTAHHGVRLRHDSIFRQSRSYQNGYDQAVRDVRYNRSDADIFRLLGHAVYRLAGQ